jgi:hypothetical protein
MTDFYPHKIPKSLLFFAADLASIFFAITAVSDSFFFRAASIFPNPSAEFSDWFDEKASSALFHF